MKWKYIQKQMIYCTALRLDAWPLCGEFKLQNERSEEMIELVRAFAAFVENLASVFSTHKMTHNHHNSISKNSVVGFLFL